MYILITIDISCRSSFENCGTWLKTTRKISINQLLEHTKRVVIDFYRDTFLTIYYLSIYYLFMFYLGSQTTDIPILLIGNKLDLHERREVTEAEAKVSYPILSYPILSSPIFFSATIISPK